jgi:galactose mutarotase-like enzyme
MYRWLKTEFEGYEAWQGESERLRLIVIPELGSKVISLVDLKTNREWLWRSGKQLGNKGYGTAFGEGDESGWDEMFPGIASCFYPEDPWKGKLIPDHGEVWALPWKAAAVERGLQCEVKGLSFPYLLEKRYFFLDSNTLRIEYQVHNLSHFPFSFQWAAHPLFRVNEGMKLQVPDGLSEIIISYSEQNRLGVFGDRVFWPGAESQGVPLELDRIEQKDTGFAEKYYFYNKVPEGLASLLDPLTNESVTLRFSPAEVPYLAVWANYGGYSGYNHAALEPSTAFLDKLDYAMGKHKAAVVAPNGVYKWYLEVSLGGGMI